MANYSEADLLAEINHEKSIDYIPITIYIAVLYLAGLVGNALVIAFYSNKSRLTPTTRLIFMIAIIDELICIIMPVTFAELTVPYKFSSTVFCKIYYTTNYILCLWETYVLLAIGVFRYRKICVPLKTQFTIDHANYATVMAFFMAVLITFPVAIFFRSIPVPLTVKDGIHITGYECNTSIYTLQTEQLIHNIMILTNLTVTATALLIMYGLAVVRLRKHNSRISLLQKNTPRPSITKEESTSYQTSSETTVVDARNSVYFREESQAYYMHTDTGAKDIVNGMRRETSGDRIDRMDKRQSIGAIKCEDGKKRKLRKISTGMTSMLFVITIIFIVSYLPYVIMTIRSTVTRQKYRTMSNWMQFISQSYRLNSVFNPFVYGYYNKGFRQYIYTKMCRLRNCTSRGDN